MVVVIVETKCGCFIVKCCALLPNADSEHFTYTYSRSCIVQSTSSYSTYVVLENDVVTVIILTFYYHLEYQYMQSDCPKSVSTGQYIGYRTPTLTYDFIVSLHC
jgi:hypothetical protein